MQIAYLDCFSGVSGDMLLGALLDAGLPAAYLREVLTTLPLPPNILQVEHRMVQGFAATAVSMQIAPEMRHHHKQHEHHGGEHTPHHEQHCCPADHHHEAAHQHRGLADIARILNAAPLDPAIRNKALSVFTRLAEAEAAVHGTSPDAIHFHEVGAVDALADIVGTVAGFAWFGIERLICSALPMPTGWVRCAHGEIPLPAPAVCHLLRDAPVYGLNLQQELVTPTGAALVMELAQGFGPIPPIRLTATGYGTGTQQRDDGRPNLLRLMLGSSQEVAEAQVVEVLETHLDDWNPEFWPLTSERLMAAGALDVCLIPMQMKKGRPGFLLRVLVEPVQRQQLVTLLLNETSATGLRIHREERQTLARQTVTVRTPWGAVRAQRVSTPTGPVIVPEYEVCRALANQHNLPLQQIYAAIRRGPADAPQD